MEIVTHILAADEDEVEAIGESPAPLDEWSGIEADGFDTMKLATLHSLLTGDALQTALDLCEPIYVSDDETMVLRVADELLEKLAALDEESLDEMSNELAATEEFEREQWIAEDLLDFLTELSELAQLAESQGQALLVRIAPAND
jgi:hypothetical protein